MKTGVTDLWRARLTHLGGAAILVEHKNESFILEAQVSGHPVSDKALKPSTSPQVVAGVRVASEPYEPIPWATPREAVRKLRAALLNPVTAGERITKRLTETSEKPHVYELTFPDGARLVHLACSLHSGTDPAWLDSARQRYSGADWMIVGVDYEEEAAVLEHLPGFSPGVLMLTDLINDERSKLGMPTRLLTPMVDKLIDRGVNAFPFAGGATYRFK